MADSIKKKQALRERFISATTRVKETDGISYSDLAKELDLDPRALANIRNRGRYVSKALYESIVSKYPYVTVDNTSRSLAHSSEAQTEILIETQRTLIGYLEREIDRLRAQLSQLERLLEKAGVNYRPIAISEADEPPIPD